MARIEGGAFLISRKMMESGIMDKPSETGKPYVYSEIINGYERFHVNMPEMFKY